LFVIDPRPYQADYDRAAADLKRYKTALELARIESTRVQHLKDSGAVSQEELDERKSTVAQAEANVAGSQASAGIGGPQLELHASHESDRRTGQPRRGDPRQSGHRRQQRRYAALVGGVDRSHLSVLRRRRSRAILRYTQMARSGERTSSRDAAIR
jgi:multidrug efflux system membrane fusion protein